MAWKNPCRSRRGAASECGSKPTRSAGFTLIEVLLVIVMLGVVSAISMPAIGKLRISASVSNARYAITAAIATAKSTAIRYGRTATLQIDTSGDRIWVEVDTTAAGNGSVVDTLSMFYFNENLAVELNSNRTALCFDSRGVATILGGTCTQSGAVFIVSKLGKADTVVVGPLGRVLD